MPSNSHATAKKFALTTVFLAFVLGGPIACTERADEAFSLLDYARTPGDGAIPEGLQKITRGMPRAEVVEILGPYHTVYRPTFDGYDPSIGPLIDYLTYKEDDATKLIEIWYSEDGLVSGIVYGYKSIQGIQ